MATNYLMVQNGGSRKSFWEALANWQTALNDLFAGQCVRAKVGVPGEDISIFFWGDLETQSFDPHKS